MKLRKLPIVLAGCLLAAGTGYAQFVVDSVWLGYRWTGSFAYNHQYDVVYGASEEGPFFAIACWANTVCSQINVLAPLWVAYDSLDRKAYCTYGAGGEESLLVVDGWNHQRVRSIPLPGATVCVWNPDNNRLYVSGGDENNVAVVDCTRDSVIATVRVGRYPIGMELNRRHQKLYVRNWDGESVSIIDLATNQVVQTISLGTTPECGYYSQSADKYYCDAHFEVVVLGGASDSIVARIALAAGSSALSGSDVHGLVMAACESDSIMVIDQTTDSIVSRLPVGRSPMSLAYSELTNLVYSANAASDNVTVIAGDGSRVLANIRVADAPTVLQVVPEYGYVYVGHSNSIWVYVIKDTLSGVAESGVAAARRAGGMRVSPNPFSTVVNIEVTALRGHATHVGVYSLSGALVRLLPVCTGGASAVAVWDGRDECGNEAAEGVYAVVAEGDAAARARIVKAR